MNNWSVVRLFNRINKDLLKRQVQSDGTERHTLSFYKYTEIKNPFAFRDELYAKLQALGVLGRIYIACEGVNAQISVPAKSQDQFIELMSTIDPFQSVRLNWAVEDSSTSFFVLKIKVRDKIVADGIPFSVDIHQTAPHLSAREYNEMAQKDDVIIIDMRNHYESEVGHFKGAIKPDVETFRESLPIVEDILQDHEDKSVIMYCTGGIRCEKATAYFRQKGYDNLYQVEGGIIEYSRQAKNEGLENLFIGKNFVFDERLGERISNDIIAKCHQCGKPADRHVNCANDACHILFIQCNDCAQAFNDCCSQKCNDFVQLPVEEQKRLRKSTEFNGTKMGKGRYKAHHASTELNK